MQPLRRTGVSSFRKARPSLRQQPKRYAHDSHGHAAHDAHHGPVEERFGKGFYITIGSIPAGFALYKFSRMNTDEQPWFTRYINSWSYYKTRWAERNDLHTKMIEQAAADRNLFLNSRGSAHVDLRFPEIFNTGSPWNIQAGQAANMDKLIAHYEKQSFEAQEKQMKDLREGKLLAEQSPKRIGKNPPSP
ncbi:hypothetical protein H2201_000668 [Coniosporium apollinis]|uniref:Uncharacterized protein n=1 Tax=Coniosporium apollinis TaxID=61459 RepID=A0ABQ9P3Z8_9PEZI|nr:hypothetical protein H2201_000668 [Coniosporium apollinis]